MSSLSSLFIFEASTLTVLPYLLTGFSLKLPLQISASKSFLESSTGASNAGGGSSKALLLASGGGGGKCGNWGACGN
jgi:hypothetical protein